MEMYHGHLRKCCQCQREFFPLGEDSSVPVQCLGCSSRDEPPGFKGGTLSSRFSLTVPPFSNPKPYGRWDKVDFYSFTPQITHEQCPIPPILLGSLLSPPPAKGWEKEFSPPALSKHTKILGILSISTCPQNSPQLQPADFLGEQHTDIQLGCKQERPGKAILRQIYYIIFHETMNFKLDLPLPAPSTAP